MSTPPTAPFIDTETANTMIGSYLDSVSGAITTINLHSLIIDANALRSYLTDSVEGQAISTMKIMLAHTEEYIDDGNQGRNCGYQSGALTVVLAGINGDGNYVLYNGDSVMNNAIGCPTFCPTAGTSANDLLPRVN